MKITATEIDRFLVVLEEIPRRLAGVMAGTNDSRLHFKADKRSWSANDVLAHIRSCADVWGQSIESMLAEDNPTLTDIHPRKWIRQTNYTALDFRDSFKAYASQWAVLLRVLKRLSFEDWSRSAVIAGRRHTIFTQARRMARHETEHFEKIESLLQRTA